MYYGFNTKNENIAIGSLLVYGIYRSKDNSKFKVTPDMWGIIERGVKSASKRAITLNDFIEKLKPKLSCSSIRPSAMMAHVTAKETLLPDNNGGFISLSDNGKKEFWIQIIEEAESEKVLEELYKHTSFVIVLVRDRLEREKQLREKGLLEEEQENE